MDNLLKDVEELQDVIINFHAIVEKLQTTKLNNNMIALVISRISGVNITVVKRVLLALPQLKDYCFKDVSE